MNRAVIFGAGVLACVAASSMWLHAQATPQGQGGGAPTTQQPGQGRPAGQPAQPGQPGQPGAAGQSGREGSMPNQVTLTGCIQRDSAPGGAQAGPSEMFKLTNASLAEMGSAAGGSSSASPGAGGREATDSGRAGSADVNPGGTGSRAAGAMAAAREYRLSASGGVNLSQHVNHRVRLMGTVTPAGRAGRMGAARSGGASGADAGASSPAPASGSSQPGAASSGGRGSTSQGSAAGPMSAPMLNVTSLTMLSTECGQ
jgi:hypothetical protein